MNVKFTTLDNGLRVLTDSMPHLESASIGVWVDAGARHETPEENGIAHLLEHMAFKGTKRRSAQQIAEEVENVGGHLNAYTGREHTAYYARVLKDDVPLAMDILADILLNSTFAADELEREREVVIQEIAQAHDTPDDIVFDHLQAAAYPEQPIGRPILGDLSRVAMHGQAALRGFMANHYLAQSLVVVAAGAVEHDEIVSQAADAFGALKGAANGRPTPARWLGGEVRDRRELEQIHLAFGFDAVSYYDDDFYPLQVLSTLLGGGMSSRLFQEIRERRGLAYSVFSFASSYVDGGLFGVYAGTAPAHVVELVPVVCDEIQRAALDASEEEVMRARTQIKAGLLMSLESSASRIEQLGRQVLIFERPLTTEEVVARIDAVDPAAVKAAAERVIRRGGPAVAAVGPIDGLESYDRLVARFG